nr:TonB-dependent receptor [uncultured Chitinophaga sp.]
MGRISFISLVVVLSAGSMLFATGSRSQDLTKVPVSAQFDRIRLGQVFTLLENQSGLTFSYPGDMKDLGPVSMHLVKSNMQEVLYQLSEKFALRFSRTNSQIAVSRVLTSQQPVAVNLRGRVVDFETSMPLPGASVMLLPLNKGMATDDRGYYQLAGITPGKYQLKVRFIGYQELLQTIVVSDKDLVIDVKLRAAANLNTVEVTSRQRFSHSPVSYSSDKELLTEIRSARGVVSGISNEQIAKSADRNAAEIVRRISGVTVVDDKFIVVRGMNPRYNLTYLNDNIAPSTEVYNRSFAYDLLPAPIIDKILVFKSPAAELLGDYAGGAVKVVTKNTRPVRHFDLGVQLGYREGTSFQPLNAARHSSTDWLGFDDGSRKLNAGIPGYRESGGNYQMSQAAMISKFSNEWTYGRRKALPDMQFFLNYFDNLRLGKWRLYNLTALTYTGESRHYQQERQTGNTYAYMLDKWGVNVGGSNTIGSNDLSTEIAKVNLLQNFTLRIDSLNRIEWNNFLLNEGRNTVAVQVNHANIFPSRLSFTNYQENKQNTLQFQQRFLYNGNLGGYHTLNTAVKQQLHWNLGYSYSMQHTPDQRVSRFMRNYSPFGRTSGEDADLRWVVDYGVDQNHLFMGMMNRFFVKNMENTYNGSLDYTAQLTSRLQLKAGTYHLFRNRVVDRRFFKVNRGGLTGNEVDLVYTPGGWDNSGLIDPKLLTFREQDLGAIWHTDNFRDNGTGLQLYDVSTPLDHYVASEQNNSGYVQGEWSGKDNRFSVQAGVRFEHNMQQVSGAANLQSVYVPVHVKLEQNKLLPSVQVNYRPAGNWTLRSSYGRTVNRPELREISPFSDFDFVNMEQITGNVVLVGTTIDNYDFRAELYPGTSGNETISAGVFLKSLDKPIERLRFANGSEIYGGLTGISFVNADKATVYGAELEVRKNLGFLSERLLRHFSLVVNGALIESKVSRTYVPDVNKPSAPGHRLGSFSGRPLQGQASYVLNTGLFYENAAWGTKMGVLYNVNGPSIYAIADGNAEEINKLRAQTDGYRNDDYITLATRPDLLELPRHLLDFSLTQRLYKSLQLRVNIQNLLDQPVRIVEDQNYNHRYDKEVQLAPAKDEPAAAGQYHFGGDNIFLKYKTGRYYTLTFTYSF